jgi:hypothetical protein
MASPEGTVVNAPTDANPDHWHRHFGACANNAAWTLAELPVSEVNRLELLNAAHAAAWHWEQIGTKLHRMRALMLVAQAHARAGLGATALAFADEMRAYFLAMPATPDWERAFAWTVHAHAAWAAGASNEHARSYAAAVEAVAAIADDEDRTIVQRVFRHLPTP